MPAFMEIPAVAFLFILFFGWVVTLTLRPLVEHVFYWTRWFSFNFGVWVDAWIMFCASYLMRGQVITHPFLTNFYFHGVLFLVGLGVAIFLEVDANKKGRDPDITPRASNLYFIPALAGMIHITLWTVVVIAVEGFSNPGWALFGYIAGWVALGLVLWVDNLSGWVDTSPERINAKRQRV